MDDKNQIEFYKLAIRENIYTMAFSLLCVSIIGFTTHSLWSLLGLLMLVNLNVARIKKRLE